MLNTATTARRLLARSIILVAGLAVVPITAPGVGAAAPAPSGIDNRVSTTAPVSSTERPLSPADITGDIGVRPHTSGTAGTTGTSGTAGSLGSSPSASTSALGRIARVGVAPGGTARSQLVQVANRSINAVKSGTVDYVWGGGHGVAPPTSPDNTDCSGFTRWAYWISLGYDIGGDSSQGMRTSGQFTKVTGEAQPGDAVFFGEDKGKGRTYHVAVYIGRDISGNRWIAENTGVQTGARISNLDVPWRLENLQGIYRLTAIRMQPLLIRTWFTSIVAKPAAQGRTSTISGVLTARTGPVAGAEVVLDEYSPRGELGPPIAVKTTRTATNGTFRFTLPGDGVLHRYQVHYVGTWKPYLTARTGPFYLTGVGSSTT